MDRARPSGARTLAGFYFVYFAAIGVTLPFLPAYLHGRLGLSSTQIGLLLSLSPFVSLFAPPRWGALADRTGRADILLRVVSFGAALCFVPVLWLRSFFPIAVAITGHAVFASALIPLIDTLTLRHVRSSGGSYARIRLFGSLGFVLSSAAFGTWGAGYPLAPVVTPLVLMATYVAWSHGIHAPVTPAEPHALRSRGLTLLRDAPLAHVLGACALHWIACTPFNGTFPLHVSALGLPAAVIGGSAALGVLAEVAVMIVSPTWTRWLSSPGALCVAFLGSALRWLLTSMVQHPPTLVLISALHGFTFGVFYVSAVAYVARRVPETQRALGQGLFVSVTFGLGGLVGYSLSGLAYDRFGGSRVFLAAAAVELVAALWVALGTRGLDARTPPAVLV